MIRCKGCGIGFGDDPQLLAVHLTASRRCLAAYNDHTIWHDGWEIVWGTLHIDEFPSEAKSGKWRIRGIQRNGLSVTVRREKTKTKAQQWIDSVTK